MSIPIVIKDKSEDNNTINYGSRSTSSNWISITDTKTDEFNALKQYLDPPSYTATFTITGEQLRDIFCINSKGNSIPLEKCKTPSLEECKSVANLINKYSDAFGITDAVKMSHFIGQIGAETKLHLLSELSYSKNGILTSMKTRTLRKRNGKWVMKYCSLFDGYNSENTTTCPFPYCDKDIEIPEEYVYKSGAAYYVTSNYMKEKSGLIPKEIYYLGNPNNMTFFNYVYACQLDNGSIESEDGSRFRGRGFLQLTGHYNYKEKVQKKWDTIHGKNNKDFMCRSSECDTNLEMIAKDLDMAMQTALTFWADANANDFAKDVTDTSIKEISVKVNGGEIGLPNRKIYTKKAYEILK